MPLPPMLSPTLPPWAEGMLPKKMLSPTLPSLFDVNTPLEDSPAINKKKRDTNKVENPVPIVQPVPSRPVKSSILDQAAKPKIKSSLRLGLSLGPASLPSKPVSKRSLIVKLKLPKGKSKSLDKSKEAGDKPPIKLPPVSRVGGITTVKLEATRDPKRVASADLQNSKQKKIRVSRSYSSSSDSDDGSTQSAQKKDGTTSTTASSNGKDPKTTGHSPLTNPVKSSAMSPPNTDKDKISAEQREKYYRLLRSKMHNWIDLAREKKHESDNATKDGKDALACVISMDSLFAFIVGFDYEDRAEIMMKKDPHPNSWATLIPYTSRLIRMFEIGDHGELKGLAYQIRALIHLRIAATSHQLLQKTIKLIKEKSPQEDTKKLHEELQTHSTKCAASHDSVSSDFRKGMQDLSIDCIEKKFPKAWQGRDMTCNPVRTHHGGYRPMEDPYFVPLHVFSSLQDGCAFGYAIVKEWADKRGIECDWSLMKGR